jgi:NADPH-dependent 2,4-dienoyl-CoA reductase/sulfur reductase-like enzyme
MNRLVVVGASLAGLRAVEAARKTGFAGDISLIGAERHLPYDRPPLSKESLEATEPGVEARIPFLSERRCIP